MVGVRLGRVALAAGCVLLLFACATAPEEKRVADAPNPASADVVAAAVTLKIKGTLGLWATNPKGVWFVRLGAPDEPPCLPAMASGEAGGPRFDATCPVDGDGRPIHEPTIFPASRIHDGTAYLLDAPPGRYVAVAIDFTFNQYGQIAGGFLVGDLVEATQVSLRPGEARYMGSYAIATAQLGVWDARQQYFERLWRAYERPKEPVAVAGLLPSLILNGPWENNQVQRATWRGTEDASRARSGFLAGLAGDLGASGWVGRFASGAGEPPDAP